MRDKNITFENVVKNSRMSTFTFKGFFPSGKPLQYIMCNQHHLNKAKYRLGYQTVVADFAHGLGKTGFSVATQHSW